MLGSMLPEQLSISKNQPILLPHVINQYLPNFDNPLNKPKKPAWLPHVSHTNHHAAGATKHFATSQSSCATSS